MTTLTEKEIYNYNPVHNVAEMYGSKDDQHIMPGTKQWRKTLKAMIKEAKKSLAHSEGLLATGEMHIRDNHSVAMERLVVKILTYAFYHDTRNAVLEFKKYKVLCQNVVADALGDDQLNYACMTKQLDGTFTTESLKGERAFKIISERMQSDIEFYEGICRSLVAFAIGLH